ncbi:MAG TPA: class I lanthipeptide [Holophagaceae bacterium]|nr:class I lanthipeptide [Holophagaceae bacterium]
MTQKRLQKLKLDRETLSELTEPQLAEIQGGRLGEQFSNGPINFCYTIWTCARGGCQG